VLVITRLPSNLRHEPRKCIYLVKHGHFQSLDKDGGYTTRSATPENPMLHTNCTHHGSVFYRTGVIADQSFTLWEQEFSNFWLLWPWPWPDDLHIWTWPVVWGDMLHVQIWTSYVKVFESYHLTDRHTYTTKIIHHATLQVVNNCSFVLLAYF